MRGLDNGFNGTFNETGLGEWRCAAPTSLEVSSVDWKALAELISAATSKPESKSAPTPGDKSVDQP